MKFPPLVLPLILFLTQVQGWYQQVPGDARLLTSPAAAVGSLAVLQLEEDVKLPGTPWPRMGTPLSSCLSQAGDTIVTLSVADPEAAGRGQKALCSETDRTEIIWLSTFHPALILIF